MSSSAKQMSGSSSSGASQISLDVLSPENVATTPQSQIPQKAAPATNNKAQSAVDKPTNQTVSGAIDNVYDSVGNSFTSVMDNTKASMSDAKERKALDKGFSQAKETTENLLGEKGITGDLSDNLFKEVAKQAVDGKIDFDKIQSINQIGDIVNSLKGSVCMNRYIDSGFTNSLFDKLGSLGFDLSLSDLFECLKEELKSLGGSFLNTIVKENTKIIRDGTLGSLKGVSSVVGGQVKELVPNFSDSLSSFSSSGDSNEDYNKIKTTMTNIDKGWDESSGKKNLNVYNNMSKDASKAIEENGTPEEKLALGVCKMF